MARTVRLYLDEHVPSAVAHGLRLRGADVLTTGDAGMLSASDEAQLALATAQRRCIVTQDDDFLKLHAAGATHFGIIYGVQALSIGDMVRGIMLIVDILSTEDMREHVEFL